MISSMSISPTYGLIRYAEYAMYCTISEYHA